MAARKYSEGDIARLASRDYSSLDPYQKRLVSGYNRGLSRAQSAGHARTKYGELPVSQRPNMPKLLKGTGKAAPSTPKGTGVSTTPSKQPKSKLSRPVLPVAQRTKVTGPYVKKVFSRKEPEKLV